MTDDDHARHAFRRWCRGPRNARRLDLIETKHLGGGLTEGEAAELEGLQAEANEVLGPAVRDRGEFLEGFEAWLDELRKRVEAREKPPR